MRAPQYRAWRQWQLEALASGSGVLPKFSPDARGSERDCGLLARLRRICAGEIQVARMRSAMRPPRTRGAYGCHPYDRFFFVMRLMGHAYVGSVGARSPAAGHAMFVRYRAPGAHHHARCACWRGSCPGGPLPVRRYAGEVRDVEGEAGLCGWRVLRVQGAH
ncbi:MAG: hypothetical protein M0038_05690 [Pseudomonadota bacterium]|nr:hypothetical protein [Pseudomonadota bacterium]